MDLPLQRDRSALNRYDDGSQLVEVLTWLDDAFLTGHPFADTHLSPGVAGNSVPWVLGSSPSSAVAAGQRVPPYCFAGLISPRGVRSALDAGCDRIEATVAATGRDPGVVPCRGPSRGTRLGRHRSGRGRHTSVTTLTHPAQR